MSEEIKPLERYFASKIPFKQLCRIAGVPKGLVKGEIVISMASPFWCGTPKSSRKAVNEQENMGILYMVRGKPEVVSVAIAKLKSTDVVDIPIEAAQKQIRLHQAEQHMDIKGDPLAKGGKDRPRKGRSMGPGGGRR